ncbi:MAG: hypothetical protein U0841_18305 [Chloroflexia bacterium]
MRRLEQGDPPLQHCQRAVGIVVDIGEEADPQSGQPGRESGDRDGDALKAESVRGDALGIPAQPR